MSERIVPTVGRIVLAYVECGGQRHELPAIITRVFPGEPGLVNAKVFCDSSNCDGDEFLELYSAPMLDAGEGADLGLGAWCEWMPYQKGQAAMTEAIAKKAGINA